MPGSVQSGGRSESSPLHPPCGGPRKELHSDGPLDECTSNARREKRGQEPIQAHNLWQPGKTGNGRGPESAMREYNKPPAHLPSAMGNGWFVSS